MRFILPVFLLLLNAWSAQTIGVLNKHHIKKNCAFWSEYVKTIEQLKRNYEVELVELEDQATELLKKLDELRIKIPPVDTSSTENELFKIQTEGTAKSNRAKENLTFLAATTKELYEQAYKKSVADVAQKRKTDLIFDRALMEHISDSTIDITDDVIDQLNKQLPAKKFQEIYEKVPHDKL